MFLCKESPILRALLAKISRTILSGGKLLVTENVMIIAWHWEFAIQLTLVGALSYIQLCYKQAGKC